MTKSRFPSSSNSVLVADASAIINLNATGCAAEILKVIKHPLVVTEEALTELERGASFGHQDASQLRTLAEAGLAHIVNLGDGALRIYESLVSGAASQTLGDGEAASISYACEIEAIVLIDERIARRICERIFPHIEMVSSAELIAHELVRNHLGLEQQAEAMFLALQNAKMGVPANQLSNVINLIGSERAGMCLSLPKTARQYSGSDSPT